VTLREKRGDDDLCKKISFMPAIAELHVHMILGAIPFAMEQAMDHQAPSGVATMS
jgi:hypothetical protein